jgi:hypothetical protein
MLNRNSKLVLWIGALAVMACSLTAYGTAYNFPNSSLANYTNDPTKWQTVSLPHTQPTAADFLNAANTWDISYKEAKVGAPGSPATSTRIVGRVTFHGGVGVSGTNFDRPLLFNGNDSSTYDLTNTFDDFRFQGTIRAEVGRRPVLAGNLRLTTDANGVASPSAIQCRTGQQLNITAAIDAADCPSINIIYNAYAGSSTADSQINVRGSNNKIYSQFVLDSAIYGYATGCFGDADFVINGGIVGSPTADYRSGKLNLQVPQAISTTAKVSLSTATGDNVDPVRIALGTNNVTIRELWIDGVQQAGSNITFTTAANPSATWLSGSGTLTVSNIATQNVTMAVSPVSGDPNLRIRIFPPVGTKAYAEGYVVSLVAPNVSTLPYIFNHWECTGATIANPLASSTTVTVPTGSGISVTAYYDAAASVPAPVSTQTYVSNWTGLAWTPASGMTTQTVYFGTVNPPVATVAATGNTVTNANLGGRLADGVTYYWRVDTDGIAGQVWSFTAANSTPNTPSPAVAAVVPVSGTRMTWTEGPIAGGSTLHAVYLSTNQTAVAGRTAPQVVADPNGWYNTGALAVGTTYYWAVDATYRDDANGVLGVGTGPTWNFVAQRKQLFIKTEIAAYNINGAGDVNGLGSGIYIDDANVVNYTFPTFDYGSDWNIVVTGPRAFAIWSNAGINIGGTLDISGYAGTAASGAAFGAAHAGNNAGCAGSGNGNGTGWNGSAAVNGIGYGGQCCNNPVGAGASFGGSGGRAGRWSTANGGFPGVVYGEKELFTLYAGSGSGGSRGDGLGVGGASGGGAVELFAKAGNVTIGSGAIVRANGGTPYQAASYEAGGGSGGGIRIVASGNVTVAGAISADGGAGGSKPSTGNANNCGGGGGGGRVAIYKGGTFTQTGTITAAGGSRGYNLDTPPASFADSGLAGTVYTSGVTSTLLSACNPAPTDGSLAWSLDPNFGGGKTLNWNPAIGTTQNKLYLSTVKADVQNGVAGALKTTVTAATNSYLRARKTYTPSPALVNGTKYYWRVDTNGVAGPVWSFSTGTCVKPAGDLNGDCKVTFADFAQMASNWMVCNRASGICN